MLRWLKGQNISRIKWVVAVILGSLLGVISSFCFTQFWSSSIVLKIIILCTSIALAVGGSRLILSPISLDRMTFQEKFLIIAFILITILAPAFMIAEYFIGQKLVLFPNQIIIQMRGRGNEAGQFKINQVVFEEINRQFSPVQLSDQCVVDADLIKAEPFQVCEITFLITSHQQDSVVFDFDLSQTNGVLDVLATTGSQQYDLKPVVDSEKSEAFPVQIQSLSRKITYPIYLATWICISLMLTVISFAALSGLLSLIKPTNKSTKGSEIWIYILFAIIAFVYANGRFGWDFSHSTKLTSDAGNISSFVAATENPQNFLKDPLLSNPSHFSMYFAFQLPLISVLSKLTGSYASANLALVAPVTLIHLCGYYLLGKRFLNSRMFAFGFAIATATLIALPYFEYYGLNYDILPRSLYQALLPFALLLLLTQGQNLKRHWLISAVFTLLLYAHPVSGPAWIAVCLITLLYLGIKEARKRWWASWIPALLVCLIGVVPFLLAYLRPVSGAKINVELFQQILQDRFGPQTKPILEFYRQDMLFLLESNWALLTLFLVTIGVGVLGILRVMRCYRSTNNSAVDEQSTMLVLWWVGLLLVGIGLPLVDELQAKVLGRELMLREIRRTMRYYVPLLWLTFFWVCQKALAIFNRDRHTQRGRWVVWMAIISLMVFYTIETKPWENFVLIRQWNTLRTGQLIYQPDQETLATDEFYAELSKIIKPDESVFPDPDPRYLADSLIPRYYSLRSVAYTYKDGASVGEFLPEWWRITQELEPVLVNKDLGMDSKVVDIARTTDADYFYFIHPDQNTLEYLESQDVVFQNQYGVLISLK